MKVLVSIQQPVRQWQIPAEGVEALRRRFSSIEFIHATSPEQRADGLKDCDVAYTWILNAAEAATASRLRWVHTSAVAVETICLADLFARGIAVSNTRGVQSVPIAEHVMAMVLAFAKQLPLALDHQRRANWAQNEFMDQRLPWLLKGRTLGLIGVGTIGSEIASRAAAFGMRVVAMRRRATAPAPGIECVFGPE
jgi:phosphoglycerate dehydrogenase-like enzyme